LPLECATWAAAQWTDAPTVTVRSANAAEVGGAPSVAVPLAALLDDYALVRERLARVPAEHWAAYVLGALTILHDPVGDSEHKSPVAAVQVPHGRFVAELE
jgi:hypothetical protein